VSALEKYPDLAELLKGVQGRMLDRTAVWCERSLTQKSRVEFRKALVLGGAHSPGYLCREPRWGTAQKKVPWVFWAARPRILVAETIDGTLRDWLPFLEAAAKAGDSVLLVSPEARNEELLAVFLVNTHRESLLCCPVLPGAAQENLHALSTQLASDAGILGRGKAPSAELFARLPRAAEVSVRADAALVLPNDDQGWDAISSEVAILHVGGQNYDDQQERLEALSREIQGLESYFEVNL
jgi:hypothetical protein